MFKVNLKLSVSHTLLSQAKNKKHRQKKNPGLNNMTIIHKDLKKELQGAYGG